MGRWLIIKRKFLPIHHFQSHASGPVQVLHNWKERKRAECVPLRVNLTYITLPWWSIVNSILTTRDPPMLTF